MKSAVFFQIQSFLVYTLMAFGISRRKQRKVHVPVMISVLIWDIVLIAQIEFNRGAVEKAANAMINPLILNVHVGFATLCVIFYFLLLYTGRKLLNGQNSYRLRHRLFGWSTFLLRTLVLITSFFVVKL